ncbi:MAG: exodeoxyribonuclease VII large subunit [Betaproteobacteria bacterium]|nr:MAG: exodeoxyribonuclease VII large subunit [Betaproteobacteria bacterium]
MHSPPETDAHAILSVSELNHSAKDLLEHAFPLLWVSGEISNLKRYDSGHWYFSLKDANAQVRCVIFNHKNKYLDWQPEDGMQVEVRALVTLYKARGDFQLNVNTIRLAGRGALFKAFEQLKAKLEKEGLFDPARKKPLPSFPKQIGIVTSYSGAALRDVLSTLQHRMPSIPVIIYPTPVQGDGAAIKIAGAIQTTTKRSECDVLILCRGGGDIEDLWAFNEEIVARTIALCPIPIICGVGHETDFTIADFIADIRAPTPTGAAHLICPDREELLRHIKTLYSRIQRIMQSSIENRMQHIDMLSHRLIHPNEQIHIQFMRLQHFRERLASIWLRYFDNRRWSLRELNQRITSERPDVSRLETQLYELDLRLRRVVIHHFDTLTSELQRQEIHLAHLNPQSVLERGYSIAYDKDGNVLRSSDQFSIGDDIRVSLAKGWGKAKVLEKGK